MSSVTKTITIIIEVQDGTTVKTVETIIETSDSDEPERLCQEGS